MKTSHEYIFSSHLCHAFFTDTKKCKQSQSLGLKAHFQAYYCETNRKIQNLKSVQMIKSKHADSCIILCFEQIKQT